MSSSFANSFDQSPTATRTHSFYSGYNAPHSFPDFDSTAAGSNSPISISGGTFVSVPVFLSSETNDCGNISPEIQPVECYSLREWRRQNEIRLEEKEKREKELLNQIIVQADEYKAEFYRKREATCESKRAANRKTEQVFVASQEKLHAEADKDYWKCIAEIIHKEDFVTRKGKYAGKTGEEKKASVVVVQGPKCDLSRMRQILLKLKHNPAPHLKQSSSAPNAGASATTEAVDVV